MCFQLLFLVLLSTCTAGIPGIVLNDWNLNVFLNLPRFEDILAEGKKQYRDEIQEMLVLIEEFELEDFVKVQILHRHFELFENEMLVESEAKNESVWKSVVLPVDMEDFNVKESIPYVFKFQPDRLGASLYPLEFSTSSEFKNPYDLMFSKNGFLKAIYLYLKQNDLLDAIGISLIEENSSCANLETTPCGERKSFVKDWKSEECGENCMEVGFYVDQTKRDGCNGC